MLTKPKEEKAKSSNKDYIGYKIPTKKKQTLGSVFFMKNNTLQIIFLVHISNYIFLFCGRHLIYQALIFEQPLMEIYAVLEV